MVYQPSWEDVMLTFFMYVVTAKGSSGDGEGCYLAAALYS